MNDLLLQHNELTMEYEEMHGQKLVETENRVSEGKEKPMDWEQAKKELRNAFK